MGDIFFFIKMVVMTFFFVLLLQIRIGQFTLEERSLQWVKKSELIAPMEEVAQGGVVIIKRIWSEVIGRMGNNVSEAFNRENLPGHRKLIPKIERSKRYLNEQLEKAENKIEDMKNQVVKDYDVESVLAPLKKKSEDYLENNLEPNLGDDLEVINSSLVEPQ